MATALMGYWAVRVMSQDNDARIVAVIETVKARAAGEPAADSADMVLAARLLGEAARLWAMSGRAIVALPWANDALALAEATGDPVARLSALAGLGTAAVFAGRAGPGGAEARRLLEEAISLAEELGTWWMLALAAGFSGAGLAAFDEDTSRAMLGRAVDAAARSRSPYAIGAVSLAQGRALGRHGQTDAAVAAFKVAIQQFVELGDERFVLAARSDMAHALRRGGRLDEALGVYRETIGGWIHLGHKGAVANQIENVAYLAIEQSEPDRAVRLLAAAQTIRDIGQSQMAFDEEPEHAAFLERARGAMETSAFDAAWAAGLALSQADAVAFALAEREGRHSS